MAGLKVRCERGSEVSNSNNYKTNIELSYPTGCRSGLLYRLKVYGKSGVKTAMQIWYNKN